jgi:hypothetical protein
MKEDVERIFKKDIVVYRRHSTEDTEEYYERPQQSW